MSQPTNETWRPILGFEGLYEVSDRGRVRSLDRLVKRSSSSTRIEKGRIIRPGFGARSGHKSVNLSRDGKKVTRKVHHLVLEAFVGPAPDGAQGLHWDDDPANNHLSNLRWGTFSDNAFDKVRNGRHHQTRKTHCPQGHEYNAENTYVIPSRPTARYCRACAQERKRKKGKAYV